MLLMPGLETLHKSMVELGVDAQHFWHRAGLGEFDCIFSVREKPFRLTLVSRGRNPVFLSFEVISYRINVYLGDEFGNLKRVLTGDGRARHRLDPTEFFLELNQAIPNQATTRSVPTNAQILQSRPDLEERDRPFFHRFEIRGKNGPSAANLAKTAALIGEQAKAYSLRTGESSIWYAEERPAMRLPWIE